MQISRAIEVHSLRWKTLEIIGESRINRFVMQRNNRRPVKIYAK